MVGGAELDLVAKAIYTSHWEELSNHRFPPVWENASEEVKNFVRIQAKAAIETYKQTLDR